MGMICYQHFARPKARIRCNAWGNWYGYHGNKRVKEFFHEPPFLVAGGTDGVNTSEAPEAATKWLDEQKRNGYHI